MALVETQQLRMLERLRRAGAQPVTLGELRAGQIDFPAVVISELELTGTRSTDLLTYGYGRPIGVRLLEPEPPIHPPHVGATGWRRRSRCTAFRRRTCISAR